MEDARHLDLIDLGPGILTITDELGSIWQTTFGMRVRWSDPVPEMQTFMNLTAMRYPRKRKP